jgi:hypothetical protein
MLALKSESNLMANRTPIVTAFVFDWPIPDSKTFHSGASIYVRTGYFNSGADDPSDQRASGTMMTLKASGESWNCGFNMGGAPGRSAPHVAA